ncbi:type II toxin-antitoxin system PemK/MazF family toxin [Sphingomonas bacterium]|uniref:type II toxin-antitoxin system PemK/MazF family toxin n=1 Tax=Sphingomonas bacterium TaxID=1895847 RepID=UPI0015774BAD|nr:type II toxin-antitoxin system PemK/MazF family toxin [Sphingomonas bacterium]
MTEGDVLLTRYSTTPAKAGAQLRDDGSGATPAAPPPLVIPALNRGPANGLKIGSQIMVDKAMSVSRDRIGTTIGRLSAEQMLAVMRALALSLRSPDAVLHDRLVL